MSSKRCDLGYHDWEPATGFCRRKGCEAVHHAGQKNMFGVDATAAGDAQKRAKKTGQGELWMFGETRRNAKRADARRRVSSSGTRPRSARPRGNPDAYAEMSTREAALGSGLSPLGRAVLQTVDQAFAGRQAFTRAGLASEARPFFVAAGRHPGRSIASEVARGLEELRERGLVESIGHEQTKTRRKGAERFTATLTAGDRARADRESSAELEGEAVLERQIASREALADFLGGRAKPGEGAVYRPTIRRKESPGHKLPRLTAKRIRGAGYRVCNNPIALKAVRRLEARAKKNANAWVRLARLHERIQRLEAAEEAKRMAKAKKKRKPAAKKRVAKKRTAKRKPAKKKRTAKKRTAKKRTAKRAAKKAPKRAPKKTKRSSRKPAAKRRPKLSAFLKAKFRALTLEGYRGARRVAIALGMAKKAGFSVTKKNPLSPKESVELLDWEHARRKKAGKATRHGFKVAAAYYFGQARGMSEAILRYGSKDLREAARSRARRAMEGAAHVGEAKRRKSKKNPKCAVCRASAVTTLPVGNKRSVHVCRMCAKTFGGRVRKNPAHMLGVTALINPATLAEGAEKWARARGLRVPARGSAAWRGLFDAWQRGGMRSNPKTREKRKAIPCPGCFAKGAALILSNKGDRKRRARVICERCGLTAVASNKKAVMKRARALAKFSRENPKKKRQKKAKKPSRKAKAGKRKRSIEAKSGRKRATRYGDLPKALRKKYRRVALLAAKRDRIALEDVPIAWAKSPAPAPHGLLNHGDLVALEYRFDGGVKRSPFHGPTYRHKSGDRGGGKRSRAQTVCIDPVTKQTVLVNRRGARPGFSTQRGLIG